MCFNLYKILYHLRAKNIMAPYLHKIDEIKLPMPLILWNSRFRWSEPATQHHFLIPFLSTAALAAILAVPKIVPGKNWYDSAYSCDSFFSLLSSLLNCINNLGPTFSSCEIRKDKKRRDSTVTIRIFSELYIQKYWFYTECNRLKSLLKNISVWFWCP